MRDLFTRRAAVAAGLAVLAAPGLARSDEPDKDLLKRWSEQLKRSLEWYRVEAGRNPGVALKPEIVLRWANPVRQQKGETALVVWFDAGRPEALASAYPWTTRLQYECVSLARDRGLMAKEEGRAFWIPKAPGVTFRQLPGVAAPARAAAARLGQMKAMAETFRLAILNTVDGKPNREELRLLPKPIHRYDLEGSRGAHPDLVDGAMFAFVQGTDPEAVLMVEAVRQGDREVWQYAFGRATGWRVEARLGPAIVWTADDQPSWDDPSLAGIVMGRQLDP